LISYKHKYRKIYILWNFFYYFRKSNEWV